MAKKQAGKTDAVARRGTSVALTREDLIGSVTRRIEALTKGQELQVPEHYAIGNAVAAWWLRLQKPIEDGRNAGKTCLDLSSDESVISATLDMIVLGLDPAKDQCYPIVYGKDLVCQASYLGRIKTLCDVYPGARLFPQVVYGGDPFERAFKNGRLTIVKHEPGPDNGIDGKKCGAYVYIDLGNDHEQHVEYMTIDQIKKAWAQGGAKGNSPAHKNFPGEMCKKTVQGRGSKVLVKASNHSYLVGVVERQDMLTVEAQMEAEVADQANADIIDVPALPPAEPEPTEPEGADKGEPDGPSGPAARFLDFVVANELDSAVARRVAATMFSLPDARHLSNGHYQKILDAPDAFLAEYMAQMGSKDEPEVPPEPEHLSDGDGGALPGF